MTTYEYDALVETTAIETVCHLIGSPIRMEIVRLLAASGETCTSEIMETLVLSRGCVVGHLKALAAANLAQLRHATHPRGAGPITYWRLDVERTLDLVDWLYDHISPSVSQG